MTRQRPHPEALLIESVDLEGQGIAHEESGRVAFIADGLPGEWVLNHPSQKKPKWTKGHATERFNSSHMRIQPQCAHFGITLGSCGGCKMQHLHPMAQVSIKQKSLLDQLWHLGKCRPEMVLRPLTGPCDHYRHRGRLSVRYVEKKDQVLVGFHERSSRYIADMSHCMVLPKRLSDLIEPLRAFLHTLQARSQIPQIEFAVSEGTLALVLRHLKPLTEEDQQNLLSFAQSHDFEWWLQPAGPQSIHLLQPNRVSPLSYGLTEYGITMPYMPTDFTQVNPLINQRMVRQAVDMLGIRPDDHVIDWFCGLGNFTLPIATSARQVTGVEGSQSLVERARNNWFFNQKLRFEAGLPPLAEANFLARNLFDFTVEDLTHLPSSRLWLWDPPREGAFALAKALADQHQTKRTGWTLPDRIVYVSCNPSTLARDAGLLVHQAGYTLCKAGILDMFPHTAHVESMALFERA